MCILNFWVCSVFEFFGVWRNEWHHKSGRSRFIPVRVRIQRARASKFDFGLVFEFFCHFAHLDSKGGVPPMKSFNFIDYLQVFVLGVHFEFWGVFSFWVFGVWRNEWHHKSGRSRFIPVRVRILRARASIFDFEWVFEFFVFCNFRYKSFCTLQQYPAIILHDRILWGYPQALPLDPITCQF